jgi:3-deoxy-7-phosphoheptulonate synthase
LNVIPAVHAETFLPVIVDPSHAMGMGSRVEQASRAAIEFGSNGLMIEVSNWNERLGGARPRCDADQAITPETLERIVKSVRERKAVVSDEAERAMTKGWTWSR